MGHIDRFDINDLINKYNLKTFIETGTGIGVSLEYALKFNFSEIYSIEIVTSLYEEAKIKFKDTECKLINNDSKNGLIEILNNYNGGNILFWLDAHFPGADFGLVSYDSTKDNQMRIPLESELRQIKSIRNIENDVFLIDDLRIYEDGPYTGGIWSERYLLGGDNINFIYEIFSDTHEILKDFRDQGYIILIPKKNG